MFDNILTTLNENKAGFGFLAASIIFFGGTLILGGCSLDELVTVDVPATVVTELNSKGILTPRKISYKEGLRIYQEWEQYCREDAARKVRYTEQFAAEIEESAELIGFLQNLTNQGVNMATPYVSALPFGALGLSVMTGLAGLFTRSPGTQKKIDSTWDEAFAAGLKAAKGTA